MKLLWYSSTPKCQSGYANITRPMVRWLLDNGHDVTLATKHAIGSKGDTWNDCLIVNGAELTAPPRNREMPAVNWLIQQYNIDWSISLFDHWTMKQPLDNWGVAWMPIDTQFMNRRNMEATEDALYRVALSKHCFAELQKHCDNALYAPSGIFTDVFTKRESEFKEALGFQDCFLIGSVGQNYGGDRKGFIKLLRAFKAFHDRHDDTRLYLHTEVSPLGEHTPYNDVIMELGLHGLVGIPEQNMMRLGMYDEERLAEIYCGFDVFCLPTYGEGFGIPAAEAQACEVPVILTNNTTGPELCKGGWLIETNADDYRWEPGFETWRIIPKVSAIVDALEKAYQNRDKLADMGKSAREAIVAEYDWKVVWQNHWQPSIQLLERGK